MSSREEKIEVKVTGADQGARDLEKMGGTAKVAGESVKGMGHEADKASKGVDDLGDESRQTASQLEKLERQVLEAKVALKALGDEYAKTADKKIAAEFDKQSSALAKMESRVRSIAKLNKELIPKPGEGGTAKAIAKDISKDISKAVVGGAKDAVQSPELRKIGMALGGALAVPLVAALGGALAGVTGLGIAGVGLAGAVLGNPEKFQSVWGVAARTVKDDFVKATEPFTLDVFDGISRIGPLVSSWHIDKIFKDARQYADPLFDGIEGLSTGLVRGVGALVNKGGPAVHALSDGMIILGKASEDALTSIADGAQGGAYALRDLSTGVGGAIRLFGELTGAAEKAYGFLHDNQQYLVGALGFGAIPFAAVTAAGDETKKLELTQHGLEVQAAAAAAATDGLAAAQHRLSDELQKASTALGSQLGDLLSLDRANDAAATGTQRLTDAFKENGAVIDGNSEKALKNRAVLQDVIGDYERQRDAAIAAGDGTAVSIGKANAVLRQHLEDLRAILIAHGDDTSAVDRYLAKLDELGGKVVTVRVNVDYQSHNPGVSLGNLLHHAGGRSAAAPAGFAVVGERGPELAYFNQGDRVFPAGQSQAMLSAASAPAHSNPGSAQPLTVRFAGNTDSAFATAFKQLVRAGLITFE